LRFRLVRVRSAERVHTTEFVWRGSERVNASGPERTLVDGFNDPSWLGGWRHLLEMLSRYMEDEPARERLGEQMRQHGRGAAHKRLGYVLERMFPEETELLSLAAARVTRGVVKLDPQLSRKGELDHRWGLWINTPLAATRRA